MQRASRREQILSFFVQHLGQRFDTSELHARFGPAFRSRVSEITKDPASPITIRNETQRLPDREGSVYWEEPRRGLAIINKKIAILETHTAEQGAVSRNSLIEIEIPPLPNRLAECSRDELARERARQRKAR